VEMYSEVFKSNEPEAVHMTAVHSILLTMNECVL